MKGVDQRRAKEADETKVKMKQTGHATTQVLTLTIFDTPFPPQAQIHIVLLFPARLMEVKSCITSVSLNEACEFVCVCDKLDRLQSKALPLLLWPYRLHGYKS